MQLEVKMKSVKPFLLSAYAIFLIFQRVFAADADTPIFGYKGDAFGPKKNAITFTPFIGTYLFGYKQDLVGTSDKARKIWNPGIRLGYSITNQIEVEGIYGYVPTRTSTSDQDVTYWGVNGVGNYFVNRYFVPYGTFGIGEIIFDDDLTSTDYDFQINYGAGFKTFIARNLALRPDFRGLTSFGNTHTAFLMSLNFTYYAQISPEANRPKETPTPRRVEVVPAVSTPVLTPTPTPARQATQTPFPDRDHDGIPDDKDLCPDEPETVNGYKDDDGCPDHEADEFQGVMDGIHFQSGAPIIEESSYTLLDRAVAFLNKVPALRLRIEGHTDSTGTASRNKYLAYQRAQSVKEYFAHKGIVQNRIEIRGYGPARPIASNKTKEGRAKNRRVEFKFLNPEVLPKD